MQMDYLISRYVIFIPRRIRRLLSRGRCPVSIGYMTMERDENQERIYQKLYNIVRRAAEGLLQGGFHTPNHRWAIASNLLECADFFGSSELAEAAKVYLREGSDCNEDGEYAERSAGGYNRMKSTRQCLRLRNIRATLLTRIARCVIFI